MRLGLTEDLEAVVDSNRRKKTWERLAVAAVVVQLVDCFLIVMVSVVVCVVVVVLDRPVEAEAVA
jgi:hypothetical protein